MSLSCGHIGRFGFLSVVSVKSIVACVLLCLLVPLHTSAGDAPRTSRSLNGPWQFQREGAAADDWKEVRVPSSFEMHEGTDFDGVGVYRKIIEPIVLPEGKRALLHFQAAATRAEVWFDEHKLGSHLGGWTPFRFDVTQHVRQAGRAGSHEIRVRVDEKVGHNTQGFLPVVCPHFGGLWQDVELLIVPRTWIDDLRLLAVGDPQTGNMSLAFPLRGESPVPGSPLTVRYRLLGSTSWHEMSFLMKPETDSPRKSENVGVAKVDGDIVSLRVPVAEPKLWSPASPNLYEVQIALARAGHKNPAAADTISTRVAFRTIETDGRQLRLNGKPLGVRGLLNWGYSPPRLAPNPGEDAWRRDIEFAASRGFNLMKFCLWLPPKRYLELADELGMLTWMEYPTWHPQLTPEHLKELRREFAEFFCYDRNHPSIVLRSLTCETGPSADIEVIRYLYNLAHEMVPGSVVEDDSSWIAWNRVHDFYDDHPYGNNHTWVATLDRLKDHVKRHGPKPLVLGEAICADTWIDRAAILRRMDGSATRPFWAPIHLDDTGRWIEQVRSIAGPEGLDRLAADSLHYGMLMRKFQVETFRREVPHGGYVISVMRDFPKASMGLIDFLERPKWTEDDWRWQGDTLCILKTDADRRSFPAGKRIEAEVLLSHFGDQPLRDAELTISVDRGASDGGVVKSTVHRDIRQEVGSLEKAVDLSFPAPGVTEPTRLVIRTGLRTKFGTFRNHWPIWVVPRHPAESRPGVLLHESFPPELAKRHFSGTPEFRSAERKKTVLASQVDDPLMNHLEAGGRVLLLANGRKGSLPLVDHWFLRGAPFVSGHALTKTIPRELFVELQHFDLAGPVIPRIDYLEQVDPILLLWDTHDLDHVLTHGLVFETRVGEGSLLVSALRHTGRTNAAGRWLLDAMLEHLADGPEPVRGLDDDTRRRMREKLHEKKVPLVARPWRFAPDPKDEGLKRGWHLPATRDEDWKEIRIGQHWEGQGYPTLDGWAWYRIRIDVPASWDGGKVYLLFEGADDFYELYVDGKLAGTGGDLEKRETAFSESKAHCITDVVKIGRSCQIAVRVHDWQGAGGLFRPITLSTAGLASGAELLR